MPRIEIELTSARPDGTWTWRAAGARQPKGVVDASVLHPGAKVGDVVRAEADVEMDGINITSVVPPKARRPEPERLRLVAPERDEPLVRGPEGAFDRGGRPDRSSARARPSSRPPDGGGARHSRPADRRERGPRDDRRQPPDRAGRRDAGRGERGERADGGSRVPRPGGRSSAPAPSPPPRERPKRFHPGRAHRDAVLATLAPEERPVAERVLRGGIPAVRQAVEEQNRKAKEAGDPEIKADALLTMAEKLLPRLRWAEWRDRADAAAADTDGISLRDLRAVVAGSDLARDDESRELASSLREALERRTAAESKAWLEEISAALTEGRVVRALRVSSRPPQPGARFPADLANRLSAAAGEAMTAETAPDRWAALLEAVSASPVRRSVQPKGLPPSAGDDLMKAVREAVGRVPALASVPGVSPDRPPRRPPPQARPAGAATAPTPPA